MIQILKNASGKTLKVGTQTIPADGFFEIAAVDAREFVQAGLAAYASEFEMMRTMSASATAGVVNAAAAAKAAPAAQPAAAKAAAAKASADDKK